MEYKLKEIGAVKNRRIDTEEGQQETRDTRDDEFTAIDGENDDHQLSNEHFSKDRKKYVSGRGIERYNNSLKNFIPLRRKGKDKRTMPIDNAGLFSVIGVSWFSRIMYKAHGKGLKMEELPKVSPYDTCNYTADRLELLWNEELARKGPELASFSKVAWRFCRTRISFSMSLLILSFICNFLTFTLCMRKLLEFVQSGDGSFSDGLKWALLLIASISGRTISAAWAFILNYRTGLRLRSACLTLLYRKIVRVNNLGNKSIGEVINLFSNDAQRIFEVTYLGPLIIEAPIITGYLVFYILRFFSPIALLGIIILVLFYPFEYMVSRLLGKLQNKAIKIADLRLRLMDEILDCIKLIKMYAWEKRLGDDILDVRRNEQQVLLKNAYCQSLDTAMAAIVTIISASVTFLAHIATGDNLTAAQVYPYSSFLESRFRLSLNFMQHGLESIAMVGVSFRRLKDVLLLEDGKRSVAKPIFKSQAVAISNATFAYNESTDNKVKRSDKDKKSRKNGSRSSEEQSEEQKLNKPADPVDILFDISFEAEKGKLVGICGQVGSGKSSLLLAALGQLRVSDGQVMRDGSCAYVSQQAWITNATLRENILFGAKFDHSRYHKAIYACNLVQDIEMMPGGDQTEIGEKGVNLSGGQKQRVALARALYANRSNLDPFNLYLDAEIWEALEKTELKGRVQSINGQLDASVGFGGDNLSVGERQLLCLTRALLRNSNILILDEATAAVDPETEIAVQKTVQREFSHCTILTIAHRLQTVLPLSRVLVMDDGEVLEFDTPSNLLEDENSEFYKMIAAAKVAEAN